jgi:hypothetical protein
MKQINIIPTLPNHELILNIAPAKNYIPEWYKKSPQKIKGLEKYLLVPEDPSATTSTYKKCPPFLDALTNGYIFYLTKDIEVITASDGSPYILWRTKPDPISWHDKEQWEGLQYPKNCYNFVYKWQNHFIIKTPKNYSTLFTHPHNRFDLPFQCISGVVDTDKYNLAVHFPFFLQKGFTGIIESGTPIAQINFFKRNHWFKNVLNYDEKFIKSENEKFHSKIERTYKKHICSTIIYE